MTTNTFAKFLMTGVAIVSLATVAFAQSGTSAGGGASAAATANSTSASPAAAKAAANINPTPPAGPVKSAMPLASKAEFDAAEKAAASSVISGAPGSSGASAEEAAPMAYGTSTAPYTTKRVAVGKIGNSAGVLKTPVTSYPFRATGKLYFQIGTSTYVCTASLVKPGVLVTAAHCVTAYGGNWYSNWTWCPANTDSSGGVYGCYSGVSARTASSYKSGTDTCTQSGVVCNNDVATILLAPKSGVLAGNTVGWYNYGWNGYSYKPSSFLGNVRTVQITQLGYPVAFDSGYQMQRTDAVGWYYTSGNLKNTQIGTAQTGGSSGGPWLVNFGTNPVIDTSSAAGGTQQVQSVIGVTSYGSTTVGYNRQGASYFGQNTEFPNADYGGYGAGNIGKLMQDTCTASPSYC